MEHMHNEELSDVARLVEVTSDAVAICDADGAVRHVNRQFLVLQKMSRSQVVGADIKDLLYSSGFERAAGHKMPFFVRWRREHADAQIARRLLHPRTRTCA